MACSRLSLVVALARDAQTPARATQKLESVPAPRASARCTRVARAYVARDANGRCARFARSRTKGRTPHRRSSQPFLTPANGSTRTRPNVGTDGVGFSPTPDESSTRDPELGERYRQIWSWRDQLYATFQH